MARGSTPARYRMVGRPLKAKDVLFEIDDYNPMGTASDHLAMGRMADRLYRGAANRTGRSRLTASIDLRTAHYARGMLSSSGEDLPTGRSLRARLWIVELSPKAMNLAVLTECQGYAREGRFAESMAGYLQWLARHREALGEELPGLYERLRNTAPEELREHNRIPANYAALLVGIELFLRFAETVGAVDAAEREALYARCVAGLRHQGMLQMDIQESSEDAVRFIAMLRSAFVTGRAYVADGDETEATNPPPHAGQLGWRGSKYVPVDTPGRSQREEIRWEARGEKIGYCVGGELWLDPEATYTCVARIAREQGGGALRTKTRIARALYEKGYIDKKGSDRHLGYRHGKSHITPSRVWVIPVMRVIGELTAEGGGDVPF
jgi:hypothetical protein